MPRKADLRRPGNVRLMAVELIYAFDNYTFDVDKRELRAAGRVVELQPQVFDLLQFLLANRDRVVSKDELLAAVWRGRASPNPHWRAASMPPAAPSVTTAMSKD